MEAREFAIAVLRADGFDQPDVEIEWIRRLTGRFIEQFGMDAVSEDQFSDEDSAPTSRMQD